MVVMKRDDLQITGMNGENPVSIDSKKCLKILGMKVDSDLTFRNHLAQIKSSFLQLSLERKRCWPVFLSVPYWDPCFCNSRVLVPMLWIGREALNRWSTVNSSSSTTTWARMEE